MITRVFPTFHFSKPCRFSVSREREGVHRTSGHGQWEPGQQRGGGGRGRRDHGLNGRIPRQVPRHERERGGANPPGQEAGVPHAQRSALPQEHAAQGRAQAGEGATGRRRTVSVLLFMLYCRDAYIPFYLVPVILIWGETCLSLCVCVCDACVCFLIMSSILNYFFSEWS